MLILTWTDPASFETLSSRFDVVTAETHEALMTITTHPVEQGADFADHAREEPEHITIEGYVSNKPLYSNPDVEKAWSFQSMKLDIPKKAGGASLFTPGGLTQGALGAITSLVKGPPPDKVTVLRAMGTAPDRAKLMFEKLTQARKARARITVISSAVQYLTNMMIERIGVPRTPVDGNGLVFQLDLRRVRIVQSQSVRAPLPTEARGAAAVAKGSQAAKAADAKKNVQMKSLLASGGDASGVSGLLGLGGP